MLPTVAASAKEPWALVVVSAAERDVALLGRGEIGSAMADDVDDGALPVPAVLRGKRARDDFKRVDRARDR